MAVVLPWWFHDRADAASAYYKDFWGRLGAVRSRALADAGCTPSNVGAIEFISPAQDAAEPLLTTTSKREVIVEPSVLMCAASTLAISLLPRVR